MILIPSLPSGFPPVWLLLPCQCSSRQAAVPVQQPLTIDDGVFETLQVAAINAMRNIVSRSKHLVEAFVALDVEELLNETGSIHGNDAQDNVKAALRDMGLKVHLKEEWTGTKGLNIE